MNQGKTALDIAVEMQMPHLEKILSAHQTTSGGAQKTLTIRGTLKKQVGKLNRWHERDCVIERGELRVFKKGGTEGDVYDLTLVCFT